MEPCKPYYDLGERIITRGRSTDDRSGVGTTKIFGHQMCFDVSLYAPYDTRRKLPLKSVIGELLWFLEGSIDVDLLTDVYRCNFWNEWQSPTTRTIGPMYGQQWRGGLDQLKRVLDTALNDHTSRRMLVDSWDPNVIPPEKTKPSSNPENGFGSLPPCHFAYQLDVSHAAGDEPDTYRVSLQYYQRSLDYLLGAPNNIASYHILLCMICEYLTLKHPVNTYRPEYLIGTVGDGHVYNNHIEQVKQLLSASSTPEMPWFASCERVGEIMEHYIESPETLTDAERLDYRNHIYDCIMDYNPTNVITGARNG